MSNIKRALLSFCFAFVITLTIFAYKTPDSENKKHPGLAQYEEPVVSYPIVVTVLTKDAVPIVVYASYVTEKIWFDRHDVTYYENQRALMTDLLREETSYLMFNPDLDAMLTYLNSLLSKSNITVFQIVRVHPAN